MTTPEVSIHPSHEAGARPSSPAPDTRNPVKTPEIPEGYRAVNPYFDGTVGFQLDRPSLHDLAKQKEQDDAIRAKQAQDQADLISRRVYIAGNLLLLGAIAGGGIAACTAPGIIGMIGVPDTGPHPDGQPSIAPLDPSPAFTVLPPTVEQSGHPATLQPDVSDVLVTPDLLNHTVIPTAQTPESSATIVDPFTNLDTATFEFPPTEQPTLAASPEPSPTPEEDEEEAIWCNYEDEYWIYLHNTLKDLIEKNPDTTPIIKWFPFAIAHLGDDPATDVIEPSQCIGMVKDGPAGLETLKTTFGYSDDELKACAENNYEIFLGENFTDPKYWKIPKNKELRFQFYKKSHTCRWDLVDLLPEYRKELKDLYSDLP